MIHSAAGNDPKEPVALDNMRIASVKKYLMAVLIGAAYSWFAVAFWGRYVINNPIYDWLLEVFVKQGRSALYFISIYTHDVLLNVLLATPAAIALIAFKDSNNLICVLVAVVAAVIVGYWGMEMSSLSLLFRSWGFWAGLGMSVLSLPIAFATIRVVRKQPSHA